MAELADAFNTLNYQKNKFQLIDYFFTQRTMFEEREFLDKQMNLKTNKVKVIHNFLALNIPTILTNNHFNDFQKNIGLDIEIFGDEGYHYKGTITSHIGTTPNFMILINNDKKIFIHIDYNFTDSNNNVITKKFINFIEVPKRFQYIENNDQNVNAD